MIHSVQSQSRLSCRARPSVMPGIRRSSSPRRAGSLPLALHFLALTSAAGLLPDLCDITNHALQLAVRGDWPRQATGFHTLDGTGANSLRTCFRCSGYDTAPTM
jgi:hypothetical protein